MKSVERFFNDNLKSKPLSFRDKFPFKKRLDESTRIMEKYPDRIPIIRILPLLRHAAHEPLIVTWQRSHTSNIYVSDVASTSTLHCTCLTILQISTICMWACSYILLEPNSIARCGIVSQACFKHFSTRCSIKKKSQDEIVLLSTFNVGPKPLWDE